MATEAKDTIRKETVYVEFEDGVAWVFMNRPEKKNAMSPQLNRDMLAVIDEMEIDDRCQVLVLEANPGCRPAALAAAVRVRQPNLVEPLEGLVREGLVSRAPDPRDGRAQALALTAAGERRLGELKAVHAGLIDGYRAALGAKDYEALIMLLRRFIGQDR